MQDEADIERPCPSHVVYKGRREYCEQGPKGHPGTCIGMKGQSEYERELAAWKAACRAR